MIYRGVHLRDTIFKSSSKTYFMVSNVFLYAENDSDKISDRLGTLKGLF